MKQNLENLKSVSNEPCPNEHKEWIDIIRQIYTDNGENGPKGRNLKHRVLLLSQKESGRAKQKKMKENKSPESESTSHKKAKMFEVVRGKKDVKPTQMRQACLVFRVPSCFPFAL